MTRSLLEHYNGMQHMPFRDPARAACGPSLQLFLQLFWQLPISDQRLGTGNR